MTVLNSNLIVATVSVSPTGILGLRAIDVVLNAGAWTHYSYAIRDAASQLIDARLIEVHLSQIAAREEFRHHSVISAVAAGTITGLGVDGYLAAIRILAGKP